MAVKKKTKSRSAAHSAKRVAATKPMGDTHKQLLALVAKGVLAVEAAAKGAAKVEKQMEAAIAKAQVAARKAQVAARKAQQTTIKASRQTVKKVSNAQARKTLANAKAQARKTLANAKAQARKTLVNANAQARKTRTLWTDVKKAANAEEKALERAVKAAEAEGRKEAAKQKAVKAFVSKWEREHKKRKAVHKRAGSAG